MSLMKTDHHVYVWLAGWTALPDSRCHIRKTGCENETIETATTAELSSEREVPDEYGNTLEIVNEISFRKSDMSTDRPIEMDTKVQVLQPITGGTWQEFRVSGIKNEGGLKTVTVKDINNGG